MFDASLPLVTTARIASISMTGLTLASGSERKPNESVNAGHLEEDKAMSDYEAYVEAGKVLANTAAEISKSDGAFISPAWSMVYHAKKHVAALAQEEFNPLPKCGEVASRKAVQS